MYTDSIESQSISSVNIRQMTIPFHFTVGFQLFAFLLVFQFTLSIFFSNIFFSTGPTEFHLSYFTPNLSISYHSPSCLRLLFSLEIYVYLKETPFGRHSRRWPGGRSNCFCFCSILVSRVSLR